MTTESKCPFSGGKQPAPQNGPTNQDWWPNQLSLKPLHQHSPLSDPMDKDFSSA